MPRPALLAADAARLEWLERLSRWDVHLFALGGVEFYLSTLLKLAVLLLLLFLVAVRLGDWTVRRALRHTHLDAGTQAAVGGLVRYALLALGLVAVVQTAGIDLTTFNVLAGAIGVGIGFGLQNIFSNFISGLIIMFERPVKVGDRIELGGIEGTVLAIGMRRTTVVTRDQVAVIVPNQRFILENVTNLWYLQRAACVRVPLAVAPGTDTDQLRELLLRAAHAHPGVLREPAPSVQLQALGGPAVSLELLLWYEPLSHDRRELLSTVNFAVSTQLREHGIRTA